MNDDKTGCVFVVKMSLEGGSLQQGWKKDGKEYNREWIKCQGAIIIVLRFEIFPLEILMLYSLVVRRRAIPFFLVLQFVPLVLLPPSSFAPTTQEWWLPALLVVLAAVAFVQLVFRHSAAQWPWYLISFAQGFNIISRLMMFMPHATVGAKEAQTLNTSYVVLGLISMALSGFMLWYTELPEVRLGVLKE